MTGARHSLGLAWHIAGRHIRHEWLTTLCHAVALAAVLAPLLVLYGLKYGVVSELEQRLLRNPANLEIKPLVTQTLPPGFFEALAVHPITGFMVPRTRPLSLTVSVEAADGRLLLADLEPTAPGDPLIDPTAVPTPDRDGIVLSESLAQKSGMAVGDTLAVVVTRTRDSFDEFEDLALRVLDILPAARAGRDVGFVSQALNTAIEDYRDGYAVPERGWDGPQGAREGKRPYAGFRLYALTLSGLPDLVGWLGARNVETVSEIANVEGWLTLDRSLGIVFAIVLGIGSAGVLISLAANLWSNVQRMRKEMSIVRLMGGTSAVLVAIPILQALSIAIAGFAVGAIGYLICDAVLDVVFRAPGLVDADICRLAPRHWLIAFVGTAGAAVAASLVAALRTLSIAPAESLG